MTIYLVLIIILFMFWYLKGNNDNNNILISLYCMIIILVSGSRYGVGVDYENYENIFYYINGFSNKITLDINNISGLEPGFVLLNKLFGFSNNGFIAVNIVLVALTMWAFHSAILKLPSKYQFFAYFILVTHAFIFLMQNQMRQACAISVFIYSIRYINEIKINRYLLINFLSAMTFHYSALVVLPLYFITKFELTRFRMVFLFATVLPLSLLGFFNSILTAIVKGIGLYTVYLQSSFSSVQTLSIINILTLLYLFTLIFLFDRRTNENKILFLGLLLTCIASNFALFERLSAYLIYVKVISLPLLISNIKNSNNKIIIISSIVVYSIMMYMNAIAINSGGNIPYRSLFERLV